MSETTAVNAVRMLAVDAINYANSGHTGICLGATPMLVELYSNHINACKTHPDWINRDRFVLSAGHGAPMLYALLHFAGFGLSVDDLKSLRQYGSKTAGHPEVGLTRGVDASTGPLGQGIGMAVGFAVAERFLSAKFNKRGLPIIDHYTYALCGDGDLQEGVAQEALSFAGHNKLSKLIVLYDSNDVQLDGPTANAVSENVGRKYGAMGFDYICVRDGNDTAAVGAAIEKAKRSKKPSFIEVKTVIGYGSVFAGDCACHGVPLGKHTDALRRTLGWEYPPFDTPKDAYGYFEQTLTKRSEARYEKWRDCLLEYVKKYPDEAKEFDRACIGEMDCDITVEYPAGYCDATRNVGGTAIAELSSLNKTFIGGSADLSKSTKAAGADGFFSPQYPDGRNIAFGVREHAMGAIVNGMNLHGGVRAFGSGFFVFSDYMKPAIRLAALMGIPSLFVFTHDSIAVGEDGPTHQPVEQLSGLRAVPNLNVFRPCDAYETAECFIDAVRSKKTPSVIVLSRQNLTTKNHFRGGVAHGGYVIKRETNPLFACLIASGSEVGLAMDTAALLEREGQGVRVVSVPNMRAFDAQNDEYMSEVLPSRDITFAVETASGAEWYKYAAHVFGIDRFGKSAPAERLLKEYGFATQSLADKIKEMLK